MLTISNLKYIFLFFLVYTCKPKSYNLNVKNQNLSLVNDVMIYKEKPFSGTLFSKVDTITTYKATFKEGMKNGKEQKFFYNGNLAELRHYTNGKKTGTHQAWWNNEQLKFEYNFDDFGNQTGLQREWTSKGLLIKEFHYIEGEQDGTQKLWDYDGKITANYIVINGESFGLIGSEKCKPDGYVD